MSGTGYPSYSSYSSYYNQHPNTGNYALTNSNQSWSNWNMQQQQYYMQHYTRDRGSVPYDTTILKRTPLTLTQNATSHPQSHNATSHPQSHNGNSQRNASLHHNSVQRSQVYYARSIQPNRMYYRNRYGNSGNHYNNHQHGWQHRNQNSKRPRAETENEPQLKTTKKKKKPLSQNMPAKKEWTMDDAILALTTEKEHNKKSKNALIIKFPDQELNKDIVAQFHTSIENVHFQQPCTPRFCFVTLQESANAETVISALNKQKFGEGVLQVEFKKDREEDQTINPEDIDPLTLYVGNLAQEITKDDMVTLYPKCKRIDIGFAKKMKFTRYAFIGFRQVTDCIDAFKATHNKQMYSKSLIVRFRRLHGTVGMPGESKPQNPPKNKDDAGHITLTAPNHGPVTKLTVLANTQHVKFAKPVKPGKEKDLTPAIIIPLPFPPLPPLGLLGDDICDYTSDNEAPSAEEIKREQMSPVYSDDEENNHKPVVTGFDSPYFQRQLDDEHLVNCQPIKEELPPAIKNENGTQDANTPGIKEENKEPICDVKNEPSESNEIAWNEMYYEHDESEEDEDNGESMMDFDSLYENMVSHANNINTLRNTGD